MFKSELLAIVKKCKVNQHPEWCGCLRPDEIIALMDSGAISIDKFNQYQIDRARADKEKGICNPIWFYFYPKKVFLKYT
jgi:hypothetical protein